MPKWTKGLRPGKTLLDVYKLFTKEQLNKTSIEDVKEKTDNALLFDAYREQEELLVKYKNNSDIQGLENVLYMCPDCESEFTVKAKNTNTLYCTKCGFEQYSDEFGFMHCVNKAQKEVRYVSNWSKIIYNRLKEKMICAEETVLSADTKIHMIDSNKKKYKEVGGGNITLCSKYFYIKGNINGHNVELEIPICNFASLPFSPGKYLEIQQGENIYRCVLEDGRLVMKFINMVKIYYQLNAEVHS